MQPILPSLRFAFRRFLRRGKRVDALLMSMSRDEKHVSTENSLRAYPVKSHGQDGYIILDSVRVTNVLNHEWTIKRAKLNERI